MTPSAEPAGECGACVSLKRACAAWPGPDGTGHPYENDTPLCGFHASELQLELARLKERAEGVSELDRGLHEFRRLMLAKFSDPRVVAKRGASSVTIDGNLDKMDPAQVFRHFDEEIGERADAKTPAEKASEDIDVANMAFLDWWVNRRALEAGSKP